MNETQCPKFLDDKKPCVLPINHPNACSSAGKAPVMTKSGWEASQLVDQFQRGKVILARDLNCKKCKGRAYNELPEPVYLEGPQVAKNQDAYRKLQIEHSICTECGGYLYQATQRVSYTGYKTLPSGDSSTARTQKIKSGKLETPDLTAARLAETQRRDLGKRKAPKPITRNYMVEAAAQAARDVDAISKWNGY